MKPYYQDNAVTIWHGDCREVLPQLKQASVDVVLTDPPYGMAYVGKCDAYGSNIRGDGVRQGVRLVRQALFEAEKALTLEAHFYVFCHWESWPDFYDAVSAYCPMKNALIWWKKSVTMGNWSLEYARDYEVILYGARGGKLDGGRDGSVLEGFKPVPHAKRVHPTEKPCALLEYLMSRSMGNGGLILDPFAGGGSVGLAAKRAGRKAVLIEIEERHCETAARRCAAEMDFHTPNSFIHRTQSSLFQISGGYLHWPYTRQCGGRGQRDIPLGFMAILNRRSIMSCLGRGLCAVMGKTESDYCAGGYHEPANR